MLSHFILYFYDIFRISHIRIVCSAFVWEFKFYIFQNTEISLSILFVTTCTIRHYFTHSHPRIPIVSFSEIRNVLDNLFHVDSLADMIHYTLAMKLTGFIEAESHNTSDDIGQTECSKIYNGSFTKGRYMHVARKVSQVENKLLFTGMNSGPDINIYFYKHFRINHAVFLSTMLSNKVITSQSPRNIRDIHR